MKHPMRTTLIVAAMLMAASGGRAAIDLSPAGASKPNIVFVMSDDQGWGDTGYNGHPVLYTPEIDAMAAAGFVFNRCYAASPTCSPSRAAILTGRNPVRCKVTNVGRYMREQEMTLAEALKAAGYVTGIFGKFHIGSGQPGSPANPGAMGFDEWVVGLNYFDNDPFLSRNGTVEPRTGKGTVITMDETIAFLDAHKDGGSPMFAVAWFPSPHRPYDEDSNTNGLYSGVTGTTVGGAISNYYDEITLLDEQLGRLRQWLRDNAIHENTILWFCSDNGGYKDGESVTGGHEGKGTVYEGGLRVPSIMEWPARDLAGSNNVPIVFTDMYPTLLAMAGVAVTNQLPLDGIDVRSIIEGGVTNRAPIGFWHNFQTFEPVRNDQFLSAIYYSQQNGGTTPFPDRMAKDINEFPQFALTYSTGLVAWLEWPWKLHRHDGATYELYNLETDPMEATNLVADPAQAARVSNMQTNMWDWQESVVRSINGEDYGL